jgi:ribosome assembly protein YihI (activator of Der GTPase)
MPSKRKKTRKVGLIGVRKTEENSKRSSDKPARPKKHTGKPAGNRQSEVSSKDTASSKQNKDPRLGSKKAVPLTVTTKQDTPKSAIKAFSPAQELQAIEDDTRLSNLLDMLDKGESLSREDKLYSKTKLARHQELCDLLGLVEDEPQDMKHDLQSTDDVEDLYERFEAIDPNQFKE